MPERPGQAAHGRRASTSIRRKAVLDGEGRHAAVHRPGPVLRRHRPRRDEPGRLPDEQRQLGRRSRPTAWSPPAPAARRSSWPASRRTPSAPRSSCCPRTCNSRRPTEPPANYIDELVTAKLQEAARSLPSELCSDEVFLRRVDLDITGLLPTVEEYQRVHGRHRPRQAGQAGRRAARAQGVLRDLGHEVGRAAAGQDRSNEVSYKSMFLYSNWLTEPALEQRAAGPDGAGAARRQRRHVQEPGDQLLPDRTRHAEDWPRTSPRSSWASASSAPSATTIRSTAGRWTTTTASPRSSPRSAASRARTIARRSSSTPAAAR